jgi:nucleotide-binding universal stress UspA family protein
MQPFRKIAVATDFGGPSGHAVRAAAELAAKCSAQLDLVHVVEPISDFRPVTLIPDTATVVASAKRELDAFAAREGGEIARARRTVLHGRPAAEITAFVENNAIDLLVTGTQGRKALERWMVGSVAEKILRSSRIPVLIVHDATRPLRRILATTDFGASSSHAVELAAALAGKADARLTLLHVAAELSAAYMARGAAAMPYYPMVVAPPRAELEGVVRRELDEASERLRPLVPQHDSVLRRGSAWAEIVAEAEDGDYDLVVVGTQGRTGPARWFLGSVAERVVRSSRPPVLVVPAPSAPD